MLKKKSSQAQIMLAGALILMAACAHASEAVNEEAGAAVTGLRDPFWPVGWERPAAPTGTVQAERPNSPIRWEDAAALLQISGLSKKTDGTYLAIMKNVGVVEENDIISVTLGGLIYRWKVTNISNNGIRTERIGVVSQ